MLLAAAAAVIDDDEGRYNGRPYKRREIKLQSRRHSKNFVVRYLITFLTPFI
jgi:hypothetical protein